MKKTEIVLASNNPGKIREINALLSPLELNIVPLKKFTETEAVEDGLSFVENAIKKARHACQASHLPAIADDSGIEVDALNGQPGIYSARYANEQASDQENLEKLLQELKNTPDPKRTARFQCVMVYMQHANDPTPVIAQGSWEGKILLQPQGENGFGYDPVFWLESEHCSAAELPAERKNQLSHRAKALQKLLEQLASQF